MHHYRQHWRTRARGRACSQAKLEANGTADFVVNGATFALTSAMVTITKEPTRVRGRQLRSARCLCTGCALPSCTRLVACALGAPLTALSLLPTCPPCLPFPPHPSLRSPQTPPPCAAPPRAPHRTSAPSPHARRTPPRARPLSAPPQHGPSAQPCCCVPAGHGPVVRAWRHRALVRHRPHHVRHV